jgi:hypothetical protein
MAALRPSRRKAGRGILPRPRFAANVAAMASLPPARGRPGRGAEAHAAAAECPWPAPAAPAAVTESHLADREHPRRIGPPAQTTGTTTAVADRHD